MARFQIVKGLRFMAPALLALGLMGCGGGSGYQGSYDDGARVASAGQAMPGTSRVDSIPGQKALQCVPYAREHSAVKIFGDANTWWDQAAAKYERGASPAIGTVLVLHNYSASNTGHVAVVKRMVSPREIRIDHANWLNDGSIYVNNPVQDVSPANDWSQVKIYNIKTGGWGTKIYPVKGFIGSGSGSVITPPARVTPRALPPQDETPDTAPQDDALPEDTLPDDGALLAQFKQPVTQARAIAVSAAPLPAPARHTEVASVAAREPEFNPPAGSPFALTAEDLAIP